MEQFGRYYTEEIFSKLLIDSIGIIDPRNILELGVGKGSLVRAAFSKWNNASFYVSDIDYSSLTALRDALPFVKSFHFDSIKEDIKAHLGSDDCMFDIAICNPPYLKIKNDDVFIQLLKEANLTLEKNLKVLTTDVVFLAKNLIALRDGGQLGIILPDGIITSSEFEVLRQSIINSHNVRAIIELPPNIFKKTEALTHILILEKNVECQSHIPMFLSNNCGDIIDRIDVIKSDVVKRMDYKYHQWRASINAQSDTQVTIGSLKIEVLRGNTTHKDLIAAGITYLHTTNIPVEESALKVERFEFDKTLYRSATDNDIIVSRVGKIGKIVRIEKGIIPVSDCLYILKFDDADLSRRVYRNLVGNAAKKWFEANAHGVCAKVISKKDLLEFPIS